VYHNAMYHNATRQSSILLANTMPKLKFLTHVVPAPYDLLLL